MAKPRPDCGRCALFTLVLLALLSAARSHAEKDSVDVVGTWWLPGHSGQVQVFELNDRYVGRIVAYGIPGKLDEKNPNSELRNRGIVGVDMFEGFVFNEAKGRWEGGTIYDFSSGRTFDCILWFEEGDRETLWARGYIGITLLGRTERFLRVRPSVAAGTASSAIDLVASPIQSTQPRLRVSQAEDDPPD